MTDMVGHGSGDGQRGLTWRGFMARGILTAMALGGLWMWATLIPSQIPWAMALVLTVPGGLVLVAWALPNLNA